jgi:serine/threonine protein kinase/TolB-like protein/Tfp pilus assembly protein PilF
LLLKLGGRQRLACRSFRGANAVCILGLAPPTLRITSHLFTLNSLSDLRDTLQSTLGETFTIERELGGGGMSRVFVAEERRFERKVVIKVLPEELGAAVSTDRFNREMQLAAKLQHPQIVPVLTSGEIDGLPYYTMPYIDGESLRARLDRGGEMPVDETVRVLRQVAAAMSYAHRHGVVHRDIKPDNVLLADDFAVVTDFGVAKALSASALMEPSTSVTAQGTALGTPAYMAPEQALADAAMDQRADIYAFGVMAYEMLAGHTPFVARNAQAMLAAHIMQAPTPIEQLRSIPASLATLVMQCLQKRPADRPQTAADLLRVLDSTISSGGTPATSAAVVVSGSAPAAVTTPLSAETLSVTRKLPWLSTPVIATVVATMIVAIVGYGLFADSRADGRAGEELTSIAVLPLDNVGGDSTDEYFSEGMTDELANALGKLPGLRLASRTSAYSFKNRRGDNVTEIGRKLNVDAVLEGAVRRSGNRLRVTAQLTKVSDGLSLWSDTYERQTRDVFQVQDDIARSISDALKLKLGASAVAVSSNSRGTANLPAYDLYLRGRFFWNRRGADNLRRSISYFNAAIARDPGYARAYAALAIAYALLPEYSDSAPPDVFDRTKAAANRALAIDRGLAEAYAALGLASVHAWDFKSAEAAYRKAIALDPRYPTAHQWYGELLYHTNRLDSSVAETRMALSLDPLAPITPAAVGYSLILSGRYDEAIAELRKGIELAPGLGMHHAVIAQAYFWKSDVRTAIAEVDTSIALDPEVSSRWGELAYMYGRSGMPEKADSVMKILEERARVQRVGPVTLALGYLGREENDKALDALERGVAEHDISLLTNFAPATDRVFDPLRSNPRFQRILQSMNLSGYVRQ